MKYVIIGYKEEYVYKGHIMSERAEEEIATFDTEQQAKDYIEKSRLKNPTGKGPFRTKSLLYPYHWAEVAEYRPQTLPHNPTI